MKKTTVKLFSALLAAATTATLLFAAMPMNVNATPGDFNSDDMAVIHSIIEYNGLQWPHAPDDGDTVDAAWMSSNWPGVIWTGRSSSGVAIISKSCTI